MSIMNYRTGRIIYAEIQTRIGSGLTLDYPFCSCWWLLQVFTSVLFF